MRKPISIIFPVVVLTLCTCLTVGFLVYGPSGPGRNEILSPAPTTFSDTVLSQAAQYYSDHFWGRQTFITAYARLNSAIFHTSIQKDITLGKDGWLYYTSTLQDYAGSKRLEVEKAAANLALMEEYCRNRGTQFLFIGVPNKSTLYPAHMPNRYVPAETHDLHRLLQTAPVKTVNLLTMDLPYFAHDSHWNSQGAAIAADAILHALGCPGFYSTNDFSQSIPHDGDLFQMLYPAAQDSETDPVYSDVLSFCYLPNSGKAPDSITIRTQGNGAHSLLMYRDSFGNLLYPYLANSFGQAVFSRSTTYNLFDLDGVDTVIIELVERNLSYLTTFIPTMPAPSRELPDSASISSWEITSTPSPIPGYTLYHGSGLPNCSCPILCSDTNAYACFQQENGGFAAHIPNNVHISGISYITTK